MQAADLDLLGEPSASERAQYARRRKRQSRTFRFRRLCVMHTWRSDRGYGIPGYCHGWFETNIRTKITCCMDCAEDRRRRVQKNGA